MRSWWLMNGINAGKQSPDQWCLSFVWLKRWPLKKCFLLINKADLKPSTLIRLFDRGIREKSQSSKWQVQNRRKFGNKIRERRGKYYIIWFYSREIGRVHVQDACQEKSSQINILKNSRESLEKKNIMWGWIYRCWQVVDIKVVPFFQCDI